MQEEACGVVLLVERPRRCRLGRAWEGAALAAGGGAMGVQIIERKGSVYARESWFDERSRIVNAELELWTG